VTLSCFAFQLRRRRGKRHDDDWPEALFDIGHSEKAAVQSL